MAPSFIRVLLCFFIPAGLYAQDGLLDELVFQRVVSGLVRPTSIANAGDGSGRLFVTQQAGLIRVIDQGVLIEEPFLDLSQTVSCCGERGLLSVAFHPEFGTNGRFFVSYTDAAEDSTVSEFLVSAEDPNRADPDSETLVIRVDQPSDEHNAGQLQFDGDGYLYVSFGDGGHGHESEGAPQSLLSMLGKILRLDIDSARPYAIPPDNPFAELDHALGEIWVMGLRNPWRFSFDRETGDLFIGDVGQRTIEEIDYQPGGSPGGENYGWDFKEGSLCAGPGGSAHAPEGVGHEDEHDEPHGEGACSPHDDEFTEPILEYSHEIGCSVTGGYRYRGAALPALNGAYLYGDYCSGKIFAAVQEEGTHWSLVDQRESGFLITTFGEDEEGEVYVADLRGHLFRIAPPTEPPSISSYYPDSAVAGGADFPLVLQGENFVNDVEVRFQNQVRPSRVIDNQRLEAEISSLNISSPGTAAISVVNPKLEDAPAANADFEIAEAPSTAPRINPGGIVGAAGFLANPIVPGSLVSLFGTNVAAFIESTGGVPLTTMLGGASVLVAESHRAPLFFGGPSQLNFQVPWETSVGDPVAFRVQVGPAVSAPLMVPTASHAPAVFTVDKIRPAQGAILIANTTGMIPAPLGTAPNTRPVMRGELLEIFGNGLGPVTNPPATGEIAISFPLSRTETTPLVTIGGASARIFFSGLAPRTVGLNQVNVKVPDDAPVGDDIPLVIRIGEVDSVPVIIAVE